MLRSHFGGWFIPVTSSSRNRPFGQHFNPKPIRGFSYRSVLKSRLSLHDILNKRSRFLSWLEARHFRFRSSYSWQSGPSSSESKSLKLNTQQLSAYLLPADVTPSLVGVAHQSPQLTNVCGGEGGGGVSQVLLDCRVSHYYWVKEFFRV